MIGNTCAQCGKSGGVMKTNHVYGIHRASKAQLLKLRATRKYYCLEHEVVLPTIKLAHE